MTDRQVPNIINGEDAAAVVARFAARVRHAAARGWFERNFRNHLLRERNLSRPVAGLEEIVALHQDGRLPEIPHWVPTAIERGDTLYWFDPENNEHRDENTDFLQAVHGVVDWLGALPEGDRHLRRLERTSVPEAIAAARCWRRALARRTAEQWPEDWAGIETVQRYEDGCKFVRLTSPAAFARKGALMGHCVGSYHPDNCEIYSLRDPHNHPHVTIAMRGAQAVEISGKGNAVPAAKWRPYIFAFIRERSYRGGSDNWPLLTFSVSIFGRAYDDFAEFIAALPALLPAAELAFDWRVAKPVLEVMRGCNHVMSRELQTALLRILSTYKKACRLRALPKADVQHAAGGLHGIELVIASGAFDLLQQGFLPDFGAKALVLCQRIGRTVLDHIERQPDVLYRLSLGSSADPINLDWFFTRTGFMLRFRTVREQTLKHKLKLICAASPEIRRLLHTLHRYPACPAGKRRAAAIAQIQAKFPHLYDHLLGKPYCA
ncbi:MAG: hypothetical protein ACREFP_08675 [Acetobacteraceae bacterium]